MISQSSFEKYRTGIKKDTIWNREEPIELHNFKWKTVFFWPIFCMRWLKQPHVFCWHEFHCINLLSIFSWNLSIGTFSIFCTPIESNTCVNILDRVDVSVNTCKCLDTVNYVHVWSRRWISTKIIFNNFQSFNTNLPLALAFDVVFAQSCTMFTVWNSGGRMYLYMLHYVQIVTSVCWSIDMIQTECNRFTRDVSHQKQTPIEIYQVSLE